MTTEELKLKVINAQAKVEKKKAIIQKHQARLEKLIARAADSYEIRYKESEIKEATKNLEEARKTLSNWKSKLAQRISEDEYLEANTPAILKDFLHGWKSDAIIYYQDRYASYQEFRADLLERELEARREALATLPELDRARELYQGRELTAYDLHNLFPRKPVEAFLKERGLDYEAVQTALAARADHIISRMLDIRDANERAEWLEKAMERERKAKLLDLTNRIMKVVGRIADASGLYIADNGEINGYIDGTEGRAKVETIGAGGYNIQRFHFRTLIHEVK